jgi:hypothetical protein
MKTIPVMILASFLLVSSPSTQATSTQASNVGLAHCLALTSGETAMLLGAGGQFASDTTNGGERAQFGVPLMPEDSVKLFANDVACAKADSSYRVWRVAKGEADEAIPIALARLGSSDYLFGTSFLANHLNDREYVIFNSSFAVVGSVTYVYP